MRSFTGAGENWARHRHDPVEQSGDDHRVARFQTHVAEAGDFARAHHRHQAALEQRRVSRLGDFRKFGRGGARAQRRHADPGPFQLEGDRLAETQDIGLAGAIDRYLRARLNAAVDATSIIRQRHHVDLEHFAEPERIGQVEAAVGAETGGVDQDVDDKPFGFDLLHQRGHGAALAEIGGNDGAGAAAGFQFVAQRPHRFDAAGAKNQVMAVLGKLPRQACADAAGCAGNEGEGAGIASHDDGSCRARALIRPAKFFNSPRSPSVPRRAARRSMAVLANRQSREARLARPRAYANFLQGLCRFDDGRIVDADSGTVLR